MLFSRSLMSSMVLLLATMLATPVFASQYQIDVLALYAGNHTTDSVLCEPYTPAVDNIIDHEFVTIGMGTNTTRKLRGSGPANHGRRMINCAAKCAQYPAGQCHYYTTGQCNGRRKLEVSLADNGDDFPAEVHTECADRKHAMLQGIYAATVSTAVDTACRTFMSDQWLLDCLVTNTTST